MIDVPAPDHRRSPEIRPIENQHLDAVARIHRAAFPESAISRLGIEATRRYYDWQLNGPHECQAIGAFVENELAGFCFGGTFKGALSGYLRANRLFLARKVLMRPWLLSDPLFRGRFVQGIAALRRIVRVAPAAAANGPATSRQPRSFGILSIAVDPDKQGLGVGKVLMAAAEREAKLRGKEQINLSVSVRNAAAIRFYERGGWVRVLEDEKWQGRMIKTLAPAPATLHSNTVHE